jgi:hypothetical protein
MPGLRLIKRAPFFRRHFPDESGSVALQISPGCFNLNPKNRAICTVLIFLIRGRTDDEAAPATEPQTRLSGSFMFHAACLTFCLVLSFHHRGKDTAAYAPTPQSRGVSLQHHWPPSPNRWFVTWCLVLATLAAASILKLRQTYAAFASGGFLWNSTACYSSHGLSLRFNIAIEFPLQRRNLQQTEKQKPLEDK